MKCPGCHYENPPGALACNLCGEPLRRVRAEFPPEDLSPEKKAFQEKFTRTEVDPLSWMNPSSAPPQAAPGLFKPAETDPKALKYCLICSPLDPVAVEQDRPIRIGRGKFNDLILPLPVISREHARIDWDGLHFLIRDLQSSNGIRVNGVEAKEKALEDRDVIRIGPYDIEFRSYRGRLEDFKREIESKEETEDTKDLDKDEVFGDASTFSGKIGELGLDEVMQMIEFNKKTGTLEVVSGRKKGAYHFRDGQILCGRFEGTEGETAVARGLSLRTGTFSFRADVPPYEPGFRETTSIVLLNAMRRLDELGR